MKYKLLPIIMALLLTIAFASAQPTLTIKKTNFFSNLFVQQSVFGGDITSGVTIDSNGFSVVKQGDYLSAKVYLKFTEATMGKNPQGYTNYIKLFFKNYNTGATQEVSNFYFSNTVEASSTTYSVNVGGIATSVIPSSWCGTSVSLEGIHYLWNPATNSWKESQVFSTIIERFTLQCGTQSLCEQKFVGSTYCDADYPERVFQKYQQSFKDSSGNCATTQNVVKTCSSGICQNGACVSSNIPSGSTKCQSDYVLLTYNQQWTPSPCDFKCQDGKCISENAEQQGSDGSNEQDDDFACTEDLLCEDGTVSDQCVSGQYTEHVGCDTGTGSTETNKNSEDNGTEKGFPVWLMIVIVVMVMVAAGLLIPKMMKRRR